MINYDEIQTTSMENTLYIIQQIILLRSILFDSIHC